MNVPSASLHAAELSVYVPLWAVNLLNWQLSRDMQNRVSERVASDQQ
jgi:hypothetical protein